MARESIAQEALRWWAQVLLPWLMLALRARELELAEAKGVARRPTPACKWGYIFYIDGSVGGFHIGVIHGTSGGYRVMSLEYMIVPVSLFGNL